MRGRNCVVFASFKTSFTASYILPPKTRTDRRRHAADGERCADRHVNRSSNRRVGAPGSWRDGVAELRELRPGRSNSVICDVEDDVNVEGVMLAESVDFCTA
jgi:hypothetical protein